MKTHENLALAYQTQYDAGKSAWRDTGAKHKVRNMEAVLQGKRFASLLEVGAGDGAVLAYMEQAKIATRLSAVEISESGVRQIQSRNLPTLQDVQLFDGYQLPYPDQHFEAVVCTHVIEHVEHPRLLLREIKRVSKYQIFAVPIDFSWHVDKRLKHFLGYGHINIFTPATFRFLLMSEGFKVKQDLATLTSSELWQMEASIVKQTMPLMRFYSWYALNSLKRTAWYLQTRAMKDRKPNAYTVFCEASQDDITIF